MKKSIQTLLEPSSQHSSVYFFSGKISIAQQRLISTITYQILHSYGNPVRLNTFTPSEATKNLSCVTSLPLYREHTLNIFLDVEDSHLKKIIAPPIFSAPDTTYLLFSKVDKNKESLSFFTQHPTAHLIYFDRAAHQFLIQHFLQHHGFTIQSETLRFLTQNYDPTPEDLLKLCYYGDESKTLTIQDIEACFQPELPSTYHSLFEMISKNQIKNALVYSQNLMDDPTNAMSALRLLSISALRRQGAGNLTNQPKILLQKYILFLLDQERQIKIGGSLKTLDALKLFCLNSSKYCAHKSYPQEI